ncbi:peptidoglycan-binding domain-containing protein [Bradyrhizobium sp.]|uniref:peptidoglycan-binding domain-containing protein n=1 Tax=Bradyrhizobium sp. TaxID=376 RepID=UPI003C764C30
MPRQIADDDERPRRRRRRGAQAVAFEAGEERGLVMRMLLHSPKDTVAGLVAAAAVCAIIANALFLQAGRHPSPMFGPVVALPAPAGPLPRPRPLEVATRPADPLPAEARPVEPKPAERPAEPKSADSLANLVKSTTTAPPPAPANVARPPAPIPSRAETTQAAGSRRIAAVQRVLTEYGYGQLKPTGMIGADTQAAIQKFERDRRLPVTGQISDRLVRELSAMIGHPID